MVCRYYSLVHPSGSLGLLGLRSASRLQSCGTRVCCDAMKCVAMGSAPSQLHACLLARSQLIATHAIFQHLISKNLFFFLVSFMCCFDNHSGEDAIEISDCSFSSSPHFSTKNDLPTSKARGNKQVRLLYQRWAWLRGWVGVVALLQLCPPRTEWKKQRKAIPPSLLRFTLPNLEWMCALLYVPCHISGQGACVGTDPTLTVARSDMATHIRIRVHCSLGQEAKPLLVHIGLLQVAAMSRRPLTLPQPSPAAAAAQQAS